MPTTPAPTGANPTKRDQAATNVYAVYTNGCLVPFADAGEGMRALCYRFVDAAWDPLTAPPSESTTLSGIAMLRGDGKTPNTGQYAVYDPKGWYRRMVLGIWEAMVAAMIAEGK